MKSDAVALRPYETDPVWLHYLKYYLKGKEPSELGLAVAHLLDDWQGLNHMNPAKMKQVDWTEKHFIKLGFGDSRLSTYDFGGLTHLVFLAHDYCIRVEIQPCNMHTVNLYFHPRSRTGGMMERHPTLEEAVSRWREKRQSK
jgi:hypothetical protein